MNPYNGFVFGGMPQNMNGFRFANGFNNMGNMMQRAPQNFNQFPMRFNQPYNQRPTMMHNQQRFHNSGPRHQQYPSNNQSRPRKRQSSPFRSPPNKKAKASPLVINDDTNERKFEVPIAKGTEKITIEIWKYFLQYEMSADDLKSKLKLRQNLHTIVKGAFPTCRLFIVGSSMTGFATKTSDVDMCLMISNSQIDQKADATFLLSVISKAIRRCSFVKGTQVIRAKVPILKFEDASANIECDLNINNTIGIRNTHLLRHYAYMDWRVRPLMLFIKRWARFHDINDASKKTISSYSLSLMLIHYLQAAITPPVLPCLQKMKPHLFDKSRDVRELSLSMEDVVEFTSENTSTLGELFIGFLNYYANIFNYDDVISVRTGDSMDKYRAVEECVDFWNWKCLRIEEPFERSNTARSVFDPNVFYRILRVINQSFIQLEKTRDPKSILSRPF